MKRSLWLVALAVAAASPSEAQAPPEPGETVRLVVTHPALRSTDSVTGTFDGLGRDSLYLTDRAFDRVLVRSLDVQRGSASYLAVGAGVGGATGGLVGSLLGAGADQADLPQQGERAQWWMSGLIGAGVGLVAGGFLGSFVPRPRWEQVPLDALAPASAFRLRLHFDIASRE